MRHLADDRDVVVDPNASRADLARGAQRTEDIARPRRGSQPERCVVGQLAGPRRPTRPRESARQSRLLCPSPPSITWDSSHSRTRRIRWAFCETCWVGQRTSARCSCMPVGYPASDARVPDLSRNRWRRSRCGVDARRAWRARGIAIYFAQMRLALLVLLALPGVASPPTVVVHATLVSSEPAANSRLDVESVPGQARVQRAGRGKAGEGIDRAEHRRADAATCGRGPTRRSRGHCAGRLDWSGSDRIEWRVVSADRAPGGWHVRVCRWRCDVARNSHRRRPPARAGAAERARCLGPAMFGAPLIPAVLRGTALGGLMAAGGLLLFLTRRTFAHAADRRVRRMITACMLRGTVRSLAAHLLRALINTSPTDQFDFELGGVRTQHIGRTRGVVACRPNAAGALGLVARAEASPGTRVRGAALAVSGAVGDSAAIQPVWGVPSKAIHLLASAVWVGGLLWLIVVQRTMTSTCSRPTPRACQRVHSWRSLRSHSPASFRRACSSRPGAGS